MMLDAMSVKLERNQCWICYKMFKYLSEPQRHNMSHTGEKAYNCDQCNAQFKSKRELKRFTV